MRCSTLLSISCILACCLARSVGAQDLIFDVQGDSMGDQYGLAVAGVGDLNHDGHADIAVGAPEDDETGDNAGRITVYSGIDGSVLYTFDGSGKLFRLGTSVDCAGDVNGDGVDDIIGGAPHNNLIGRARVFSGLDGSELHTFDGFTVDGHFGFAVAGAGDVNDDGFADVIVGSERDTSNGLNSGTARVYSGLDGSLLHLFAGTDGNDRFGRTVDGIGDVDDDGHADLVVGAPLDSESVVRGGAVHVFSGATGVRLYEIKGTEAYQNLGISVSGLGDLDEDGYDDFAAGAYGEEVAGVEEGVVHVYSGFDGTELHLLHVGPETLGEVVSRAGDLNGDGRLDILAVAVGTDVGSRTNVGAAYAFSGVDGSLLYGFIGEDFNDGATMTVADAGDVNGDGLDDVIVGVPRSSPTGEVRIFAGSTTLCPEGESYCFTASNSVGSGATIGSSGTTVIAENDFVLEAEGLPPTGFGLFYFGTSAPNLGISQFGNGWRCVEGAVTRLPVMQAGASGLAQYALDFTTSPGSLLTAGSVWYFQYWYRDPQGGGAEFNLSDGYAVGFCP